MLNIGFVSGWYEQSNNAILTVYFYNDTPDTKVRLSIEPYNIPTQECGIELYYYYLCQYKTENDYIEFLYKVQNISGINLDTYPSLITTCLESYCCNINCNMTCANPNTDCGYKSKLVNKKTNINYIKKTDTVPGIITNIIIERFSNTAKIYWKFPSYTPPIKVASVDLKDSSMNLLGSGYILPPDNPYITLKNLDPNKNYYLIVSSLSDTYVSGNIKVIDIPIYTPPSPPSCVFTVT